VIDVIGRTEGRDAIRGASAWFRKRNDEKSFSEHAVRKRGDEKRFSGHVVRKRGDEKMFSCHVVRNRGDEKSFGNVVNEKRFDGLVVRGDEKVVETT
jgi:hypothetical protein